MQGAGYLAIWSDLAPDDETDYLHWMTREHAAERVGVEGFLAMRLFRAIGTPERRYFILYELESADVVGGPDYLVRLNAPTPWSQRIMPRLGNFVRGGGHVEASAGIGQGGYLAALPFEAPPIHDPSALVHDLARTDRIAAARVLRTDAAQTSIQTREKSMRAEDRSFGGLLIIEGLDEAAVRAALSRLKTLLRSSARKNSRPCRSMRCSSVCTAGCCRGADHEGLSTSFLASNATPRVPKWNMRLQPSA
jgi:hypothetical protein